MNGSSIPNGPMGLNVREVMDGAVPMARIRSLPDPPLRWQMPTGLWEYLRRRLTVK